MAIMHATIAGAATAPTYYPHRYAADGTDRAARVLVDEKCAGKRAHYHIFYRIEGKLRVDASWAADPVEAREQHLRMVREAFGKRRAATLVYLGALPLVDAKVA